MKKFEYLTLMLHSDEFDSQDSILTKYGKLGWELVTVVQYTTTFRHAYMKRQLATPKKAS